MRFLARRQTTGSQDGRPAAGRCRQIRQRLVDSIGRRLGPEASWVQRHVAHCPRCQRRLAALGKVDLALSMIKSQPHRLDLLMRANSAAVRMLNHDLRQAAETTKLEQAKPEPGWIEQYARYRFPITNVAACIAILLLTKAGIFSSFDKVHARGSVALKQYYSTQVGEDVAKDIFGA
jgi:anti-sigma factor RsiW